MQTVNKPFTPFGVILHQINSTNIKLKYAPFFYCGQYAYQEAKKSWESGQVALCLPMGQTLDDYAWPIVGMRLILFDTGGMASLGLSKLAYGILKHGAQLVGVYSDTKMRTDVFSLKKDLQHGQKRQGANK